MAAKFIPRLFSQLRDVAFSSPTDGQVPAFDAADGKWKNVDPAGGGAAFNGGTITEPLVIATEELSNDGQLDLRSPSTADDGYQILKIRNGDELEILSYYADGVFRLKAALGADVGQDGLLVQGNGAVVLGTLGGQVRVAKAAGTVGFFGATPAVQPSAPASAQDIADALATLGLLAAGGTIADGGVTQGDIDDAIAALVDTAPGTLDTLNELAAALGDDADFAATVTTALAGKQPLDSDLTAIAALTTTSFGRALLELADQAALLAAAGAAAASHAHSGADITSGTVLDARIDSAIARDSEVTSAIAALSSVYQPLDSDLTAVAALTTTSYGRAFLALADAAAARTALGLGTLATQSGTFSGTSSGTNTGDQTAAGVAFTPTGTIAATDVQAAIAEVAAEAGGAVATALIVEWFGDLPAAVGNGAVFRVPALDGVSTTFDLLSAFFRLETAGSSTTTLVVEKSAGGGAFSASTVATLTAASGVYEHTVTTSLGTVTTGDLLRIRWTALGTGAATFLVQLEGEAQ